MILHIDWAQDTNDVFNARAEIQKILDTNGATVKGHKIEARVEPGQEKKKWLTTFFNHVRALEIATGRGSSKEDGALHLELRDMSVHHKEWPEAAIGKMNKEENTFEFDIAMLAKLNITEDDIRTYVKQAEQRRARKN